MKKLYAYSDYDKVAGYLDDRMELSLLFYSITLRLKNVRSDFLKLAIWIFSQSSSKALEYTKY